MSNLCREDALHEALLIFQEQYPEGTQEEFQEWLAEMECKYRGC